MAKILVLGSSNTDMTVRTAALPRPGETLIGGDFVMGPGGKGANQAVAARRLGGDAALVCKVGRDMFGDNAILHYEREGLDTRGILVSELPSGVALINVDAKGENCIVVAPGANMDLTEEDIERVSDRIREADIVLLQLEIPIPSVLAAARIAHAGGAQVVLNPAPYAEVPDELFRYVDLFIPNETELSAYTGITVCDRKSALGAADIMLARGVKKIIVTLGSKGSLIYDGKEVCDVAACPVEAVDTTAAGDTYCGALCVGLSEGLTLQEAAVFASKASALSVTRPGAQNSMPYRKEIN
ncbi:MAG: ribokinase [Bacteroidales bacterium]|nr:ribokinase [Bacteroidales bacterium]